MPTLCRSYSSPDDAQLAVGRLLAAGTAGDDVRVLMGEPVADRREDAVGGFASPDSNAPQAVASFAGAPHSARDTMGAFAGDGRSARRGGFGDIDRETSTTYPDGIARVRVTSHRKLRQALVEAGLDERSAARDVEALHRGRVLVLVRSDTMTAEDAARALDA
jgi:hypothetical protein